MKIILKNIKYSAFASQETHCYEATIYIDGKKFCGVNNTGHGGGDDYFTVKGGITQKQNDLWSEIQNIDKELGKEVLSFGTRVNGTKYNCTNSLEIVCGDLMNEYHQDKEVKKILKKIAYIDFNGDVFTLASKLKPTAENLLRVKDCEWWKSSYSLLNEMSFNAAKAYIIAE